VIINNFLFFRQDTDFSDAMQISNIAALGMPFSLLRLSIGGVLTYI